MIARPASLTFLAFVFIFLNPIRTFSQRIEEGKLIKLPWTYKEGYGIFSPSLAQMGFEQEGSESMWSKTYLKVKGVPAHWKNVKKGKIWLDAQQFVYQNNVAGNLSRESMDRLKKSWGWEPDKSKLSSKPIKCYVYVAMGETEEGTTNVIVDTNNNLDFGDENAFVPPNTDFEALDSLAKHPVTVQYEMYGNGKVLQSTIPLLITRNGQYLLYNFPRFAAASFKTPDSEQELVMNPIGSTGPTFSQLHLAVLTDSLKGKKIKSELLLNKNEYVKAGREIYKITGVDLINQNLELERMEDGGNLQSGQISFPAITFKGNEFSTMESISLDKYKGKYLYLDFWGTWCGPCVKEIPALKKLYDNVDKSKIEFLGIVGLDKPTALMGAIKNMKITWPQILSNDENKITDAYGISAFPTSFLINPDGIIVAKNLRAEELSEVLDKLIGK